VETYCELAWSGQRSGRYPGMCVQAVGSGLCGQRLRAHDESALEVAPPDRRPAYGVHDDALYKSTAFLYVGSDKDRSIKPSYYSLLTFCVSCALDWHGVIQCFSTLTDPPQLVINKAGLCKIMQRMRRRQVLRYRPAPATSSWRKTFGKC